jgi:hypothetical protein
MLIKDFVKWQRSNGKKMTKAGVELFKHPAVKYTTSELLLFWLEQEAKTLWQEIMKAGSSGYMDTNNKTKTYNFLCF